jgi:long-chain fatty acid transport protein
MKTVQLFEEDGMRRCGFWKGISGLITFIGILCTMQNAHASGFGIYTQSASSLGQGSAVVAHTDSPSTIFFNPALMNKLGGTQVELGTTLLFPNREFQSASGSTFETEDTVYFPSTFYITHKFSDKISAGLGVFNPFGLGTDWGETWEGRYLATKSEMATYNINPAVSVQVLPWLSLAAGLDILILDAKLQNKINLTGATMGAFGSLPDANQKFDGDGTGVGFNVGLAADLTKDISLGFSYRSEISVDPEGDVSFAIPGSIPEPLYSGLRSTFTDSGAKTHITLPQQIYAGVAYKGLPRWIFEAGMRWEGWSSFKHLKVNLDNGLSQVQARNWDDTFAIDFGAQYKLNDRVTLRGGYLFGENPVPDDTFEPAIPDSDTHLFCIGSSFAFDKLGFDLAYAYQLQYDRNKNNAIGDPFNPGTGTANGKYSTDIHLIAASLAYKF